MAVGRWTNWKLLRQRGKGYSPPEYDGAAVYKLGTRRLLSHEIGSQYAGHTGNLSARMHQFGLNGSNLGQKGVSEPRQLFVRFRRKEDKRGALEAERELLSSHEYRWNEL